MASVSVGPQPKFINAEILVPCSRTQFDFVFGREILLEKHSQQLSLLKFQYWVLSKRLVPFVHEIEDVSKQIQLWLLGQDRRSPPKLRCIENTVSEQQSVVISIVFKIGFC